jgi:hypothetical protein
MHNKVGRWVFKALGSESGKKLPIFRSGLWVTQQWVMLINLCADIPLQSFAMKPRPLALVGGYSPHCPCEHETPEPEPWLAGRWRSTPGMGEIKSKNR